MAGVDEDVAADASVGPVVGWFMAMAGPQPANPRIAQQITPARQSATRPRRFTPQVSRKRPKPKRNPVSSGAAHRFKPRMQVVPGLGQWPNSA